MKFATTIFALVMAALLLGCTAPAPSSGATSTSIATSSASATLAATAAPNGIVKAVLAADEDSTVTLSYDRVSRKAIIEAIQFMDGDQTTQLAAACAIQSTFLVRINDASLYGQTERINGTLKVRISPEKYDQYVAASGLTRQEFDAMGVTSAAIRFKARESNASMGECVNLKGVKITLDGRTLQEEDITASAQSGIRTGTAKPTT